ncbi:probable histone-lysine N-methyltransferase Mes-4 isoform X3 [Ctenocephalides felis]|uniref:probable histone-lysine N-methyltransferase Mes-4 isoform X3 n=1 Tax=Ctenocephalides felis TaxID=7515 RepID=UPI000E6E294A|nr:probable histone-lysine N-methyltransferase Mes-4 isoform X3 [Ctenocephalides felis]
MMESFNITNVCASDAMSIESLMGSNGSKTNDAEESSKTLSDKQLKLQKMLNSDFNPVYLQFDNTTSKSRSRYGRAQTSLNQSSDTSMEKVEMKSDPIKSADEFEIEPVNENLKSFEIMDKLFHENRKHALLSRSKLITKYRDIVFKNTSYSPILLENTSFYNYEKSLNKTIPDLTNNEMDDIENREITTFKKNRRKSYSAPTRISYDKLHEPLMHRDKTDGLMISNNLTPYNIFKEEIIANQLVDDEWSEGDICWGRIGSYPFWPCLICDDPATGSFLKLSEPKGGRNASQSKYYHVRFFADNGRRSELKAHCLFAFTSLEDFKKQADAITPELRRKSPKHCSAFIVPPSRYVSWKNAIEEATVVMKRPKIYRLDYFNSTSLGKIPYSNKSNTIKSLKTNPTGKTTVARGGNGSSDDFDKLFDSIKNNSSLNSNTLKKKHPGKRKSSEIPKKRRKLMKKANNSDAKSNQEMSCDESRSSDKRTKVQDNVSDNVLSSSVSIDSSITLKEDDLLNTKEVCLTNFTSPENTLNKNDMKSGPTLDSREFPEQIEISTRSQIVEVGSMDNDVIADMQGPQTTNTGDILSQDQEILPIVDGLHEKFDQVQTPSFTFDVSEKVDQSSTNSAKTLILNKNKRLSGSDIGTHESPNSTSTPKIRRTSERHKKLNDSKLTQELLQKADKEKSSSDYDMTNGIIKLDNKNRSVQLECDIAEAPKDNVAVAHSSKSKLEDGLIKPSNTGVIDEKIDIGDKQLVRTNSRKSSKEALDLTIDNRNRTSGNFSDCTSECEVKKISSKKYKTGLFQGLCREKVCTICEKPGGLSKCKGPCSNYYHYHCAFPDELPIEEKTTVDKDLFEKHASSQMQEMMNSTIKSDMSESSSDDDSDDGEVGCKIKQVGKIKFSSRFTVNRVSVFKCHNCTLKRKPKCFVCNKESYGSEKKTERFKCCINQCGNFFHDECLKAFPQTKMFGASSSRKGAKKVSDRFECAHHVCHTCVSDNPKGNKSRFLSEKLSKCVRCPTAYHTDINCIPAGTILLTSSQIICTKHFDISKKSRAGLVQHINVIWCFICAIGGSLICCEMCPTSFHVECLGIPQPEGKYICEDCEAGRFPLYNEIVWCKMATFRWWPARILPPYEIPPKVYKVSHEPGNFCVRFYGSLDHHWTTRGKVFLFCEGDTAYTKSTKNNLDGVFVTAVKDANVVYNEFRGARALHAAKLEGDLKPPYYIKIKSNRFAGNAKSQEVDQSLTTPCECDPNSLNPCGPNSLCLNRMLLYECNPSVCPAREKCCNQDFEKREYPPLTPFVTKGKGWGLKTLKALKPGQFIIEYVGDVIDNIEFNRRLEIKHKARDENFYFLVLDKDRIIDAGPKGNVSRFMNHSCDPNCETQKWTVNGDTRVGLFAIKDIEADTELTFNYNLESTGGDKKKCYCGAAKCAGFIGAKKNSKNNKKKS